MRNQLSIREWQIGISVMNSKVRFFFGFFEIQAKVRFKQILANRKFTEIHSEFVDSELGV